jgi:hypothetical protein
MRVRPWWGDVHVARRVVLVAVGDLDHRARAAASYAQHLPAHQCLAMHVVVDTGHAHSVGLRWMESSLHRMPLHLVDDVGGVGDTLRAAVEDLLAEGADEVVVVAGRANSDAAHRSLKAHIAERIHDALIDIERTRVALVAVP